MRHIRTAILGTGFMSWVHLDALRRIGVTVVTMVGSSAKKSQAACQQHGLEKVCVSLDEVLADDSMSAHRIGLILKS